MRGKASETGSRDEECNHTKGLDKQEVQRVRHVGGEHREQDTAGDDEDAETRGHR